MISPLNCILNLAWCVFIRCKEFTKNTNLLLITSIKFLTKMIICPSILSITISQKILDVSSFHIVNLVFHVKSSFQNIMRNRKCVQENISLKTFVCPTRKFNLPSCFSLRSHCPNKGPVLIKDPENLT